MSGSNRRNLASSHEFSQIKLESMQSQLLFNESPSRQLCIQPKVSGTKKPSYTLLLEKLQGSQQQTSSTVNCTARFVPANSFDTSMFKLLIQQPIYGCLGLIQVNNGSLVSCVIINRRTFCLRYH